MNTMTLEQLLRLAFDALHVSAPIPEVARHQKDAERKHHEAHKAVREYLEAHLAQPAQGRGEAVVGAKGKFISESGYCFSGTLDSVLYKVWLNDGSLVTIGRDEFILDANPTRSSPAVAPDDERLHSGSAEDVAQWLYANGHHDAAFTVRQQLDVRNERIRALESTHITQPAQAVDVGAIRAVADELLDMVDHDDMLNSTRKRVSKLAGTITRAIGNAQAEGWIPIDQFKCPEYEGDCPGYIYHYAKDRVPECGYSMQVGNGVWLEKRGKEDGVTHCMPLPTPPQPEE